MILDIRGQETGSGEQLARLMLENIDRDITNKRLLYLTGDKNRDTIPKILSSNETFGSPILLHSLQVYETRGATDFERNIELLTAQEAQPHQSTSTCAWRQVTDSHSKKTTFGGLSSSLLHPLSSPTPCSENTSILCTKTHCLISI